MRISEQWLREWVSPKLNTAQLAERLTLAGLEVSAIEPAAPGLSGVVVGEVVAVEQHPRAERLKRCVVDLGRAKRVNIVCGAPNIRAGMKVPAALPGAKLPNDVTVEHKDVRGVESAGMLCSSAELGLSEASEGLLALDSESIVGQSLAACLDLDDQVIEIDLTPNRGDALSVAGVAREVSALTGARTRTPSMVAVRARSRRRFTIRLEAKRDCPRYVGRAIEDINLDAATPMWIVERLRRSGMRSISPVVDVTNYVMLELGQPMHAFDLDKLTGRIRVRLANDNEILNLLDGTEAQLQPGTLLIADDSGPLAIAGIMGGLASGVEETTRNLFLESAYFRPETIAGRARSLGLQTESSYRFERGVDTQLQRRAMERATTLLLNIVGGRPGPIIDVKVERHIPKRTSVVLRKARVGRVLGSNLPAARIQNILIRLGMRVRKTESGWRVTPPPYRFDIEREVDLIEEVARVHGYEKLPSQTPDIAMGTSFKSERDISLERFKQLLVDRDYQEVITYSFVDPELQTKLIPDSRPLALANPISADMAVMRSSLWPGLVQAMAYNKNRQQARVRLFELGRCFRRDRGDTLQEPMLGGALAGTALPEQWGVRTRTVDFHDAKGDVEAILQITGRERDFQFHAAQHATLHPGQAAQLVCGDMPVGWLGALHPSLATEFGLDEPVLLFELRILALSEGEIPRFAPISKFPAIRRDLDVVVDMDTPAQRVLETTTMAAGALLVDLQLFDEYRGEGIDSGRKSLTLGLTLQDSSRTLKDEVVEEVMVRVIDSLQSDLGAELRTK